MGCCGDPNWVEIATFGCLLLGGLFAWWQWRKQCRVSRAEHLKEILNRYNDITIENLFYRLINNTSYGGNDGPVFYKGALRFNEDDEIHERDIDSMLLFFSQICYEHETGTISDIEYEFFCFQIRRTLAHRQIKEYLYDLDRYCNTYHVGYPYSAAAREGILVDSEYYGRFFSVKTSWRKSLGKLNTIIEGVLP